jgi:hypothetical protein
MHIHFFFEPSASIDEFWIFFVMISDDSKVSEIVEMSKKFLCHNDKIFKREMLRMTIRRHKIPSMQDDGIFFFCTREQHLDAVRSLSSNSIDTPPNMRICQKEKRESFESMKSEKFHWLTTKMYMRCTMSRMFPETRNHRKYSHSCRECDKFYVTKKSFHVIMILYQEPFSLHAVFYLHKSELFQHLF